MQNRPQCLIIAGEKSGEEHALSFFPQLRELLPQVHFFGVAGDDLAKLGVELLYHLKDFSSWGATEVFHKLPFYYHAMKRVQKEVEERNCQVAILIDFQTFNLTLAQKLQKKGVKVLYYVAPQAWAWKAWRAEVLAKTVHTLFTIIPFEQAWFSQRGVKNVMPVVHPVLTHYRKELETFQLQEGGRRPVSSWRGKRPVRILLLPGSRHFEVENLLPEFLAAIKELRQHFNLETTVVRASSVRLGLYDYYADQIDHHLDDPELVKGLKWADMALASSGTVTLTAALFQVPTVVCYKASLLTAFVFYNFISYRGPVSLANIAHDKMVFPELLQDQVTAYNIKKILQVWLTDDEQYEKLVETLKKTKETLSGGPFSLPHYLASVIEGNEYDDSETKTQTHTITQA